MALSLRNPVAREWVNQQREKVKPWSEFLDFSQFRKPESPAELKKTFIKNIEVFHANYMVSRHYKILENVKDFFLNFYFQVLTTLLLAYAIVTSPLLLLAISLFFIIMNLIESKGPKILGREIPVHQQVK